MHKKMIFEICAISYVIIKALKLMVYCYDVFSDSIDDVEPLTEEMRMKLYS